MATHRKSGWKKTLAPLALLATATLLMSGCSGGDGGGGSTDGASGGEITYWASNQGTSLEDDKKRLEPTLKRFEEETGTKVNLEVIPWSDLYMRILTAVSSGDGPDVLNIGNTWAVTLQETGAFEPVEGKLLEAVGGQDRFIQSSWDTGGKKGAAHTSVPLYGLAYNMYYNTKLFEEAGITEPPATWEEFIEVGKKLTKDTDGDGTIDQWGYSGAGASLSDNSHQAFAKGLQHGSTLFTDDDKPQFAADGIVQGVNDYVSLMAEHKIMSPSDAELTDSTPVVTNLIDGKAAMIFNQSPIKNFEARDFTDWGVAMVPMIDPLAAGGEPIVSHVAGINLSVFKNAKNKDAAIDFVGFLTSTDEQIALNKTFTSLPVVTDAYSDEAFQSEEVKLKQQTLENNSAPMPLVSSEGQMETLVGTALKDLFAKATTGAVSEADITKALSDANDQMSAAIG
ncbi:extracellular solute-binding protein [Lysinibacter cavernae]|uniref:Multiple sugar transport system substrate-binding protein n=1 Tax=Lysinibacter cavernae TaxID=1640652 RepID=A0A7X5TTF3_9MICO|nr:extracellular solute-binding protein [Lysinibacter cavernae]NIH54130.1 multiple sugar transport system substrate-binding protein [Lysinibacter cavernae]